VPELPDIELYLDAMRTHVGGQRLERIRRASPFLVRTVEPPLATAEGRVVERFRRIGKRIAIGLQGDLWLVVHLMIAGRLHWRAPDCPIPRRYGQAAFDFAHGSLLLSEAGAKKRAALHVVQGEAGLLAHDPGGLEPLAIELATFAHRLRSANHTLKRALTDPQLLAGIGNAYSDEILHAAGLSPLTLSGSLDEAAVARLHQATRSVLEGWTARLIAEAAGRWPEKVTAFRPGMAVHGRFGRPCPACGTAVQRIRHAANETNYCPRCQTGGRALADRALSRLLKRDWPRSIEELERLGLAAGREPVRQP